MRNRDHGEGSADAVRSRCPASSANLGPGFDALALALSLYVEVEVEPADRLRISSSGEGSDLPTDGGHLAARVARSVLGHDRLSITVRSDIPVGRGLGSSAALAAATAAACAAPDPFAVAVRFDGHAENAAASVMGGLVAATIIDDHAIAEPLPLDPELSYAVLIPDQELSTEVARSLLPRSVPFGDAVANIGRMGLLLAGLADRHRLHSVAGDDRLHQTARSKLFPESTDLMQAMRDAGATVVCWSGAGPSLLGICSSETIASEVVERSKEALERLGVAGRALRLRAAVDGLTIE